MVFYRGEELLGGGIIENVLDDGPRIELSKMLSSV